MPTSLSKRISGTPMPPFLGFCANIKNILSVLLLKLDLLTHFPGFLTLDWTAGINHYTVLIFIVQWNTSSLLQHLVNCLQSKGITKRIIFSDLQVVGFFALYYKLS